MSDPRLTDSDPRMTDPRDYRRTDIDPVDPGTGASNALWGWVAAALFVAAVLLFVFAAAGGPCASGSASQPVVSSCILCEWARGHPGLLRDAQASVYVGRAMRPTA